MKVNRRAALLHGASVCSIGLLSRVPALGASNGYSVAPVFSITPVLFDGKWNLKDPPEEVSGVWDSRIFDVSVGVSWEGQGAGTALRASTVAPVAFPEQDIVEFQIETQGCEAVVNQLTPTAAQLQVSAPRIERGQTIGALARYRLKISRVCHHYQRDQFPARQPVSASLAREALGNSPGIRCDLGSVKATVDQLLSRHEHPWDSARKFFDWVWHNIQGRPGPYTSVQTAMERRVGDCEERAGVFIALCRAAGIPARLVWVPNHCWAEFCLLDETHKEHWIPAHTAAYNWFGWTGAHELILQKGDRVVVPGQNKRLRLINDWYSHAGRRPKLMFTGQITPHAEDGGDPGPGERIKNSRAGWDLVGRHPEDKFVRR